MKRENRGVSSEVRIPVWGTSCKDQQRSNGPAHGMMILWNWEMHRQFSHMADMFLHTTPLETFTIRYEEVTNSSADFDKVMQGP